MVEYIKYIVAFGIASLSIYNKVYRGLFLSARKLMGTGVQFRIGGTRYVQTVIVFDYAIRRRALQSRTGGRQDYRMQA